MGRLQAFHLYIFMIYSILYSELNLPLTTFAHADMVIYFCTLIACVVFWLVPTCIKSHTIHAQSSALGKKQRSIPCAVCPENIYVCLSKGQRVVPQKGQRVCPLGLKGAMCLSPQKGNVFVPQKGQCFCPSKRATCLSPH